MNKTLIVQYELPPILPHGWKKEVAATLGIHYNTVTNALAAGKGDTYNRIMECAKNKYGHPVKTQAV